MYVYKDKIVKYIPDVSIKEIKTNIIYNYVFRTTMEIENGTPKFYFSCKENKYEGDYYIYIKDSFSGEVYFSDRLFIKYGIEYFAYAYNKTDKDLPLLFEIKDKDGVVVEKYNGVYDDSNTKNVLIALESKSLGDNLAWMPYAEEFRKKNKCKLYLVTFWNDLFKKEYPEIDFVFPGSVVRRIDEQYRIGWYFPFDGIRNKNDVRTIPMQQTASDILGLQYKEIKPKITIPDKPRNIKEKYVCIGIHGTAQAKYWNYPNGWQKIVDYLNSIGYKVILISKEQGMYMGNIPPCGVIDKTGNIHIDDRIVDLKYADMFIGIGSGLSWLSWAVGTPTIMISGFSKPFCEFTDGVERVFNPNVCNGCFNDDNILFDKGDWMWCPRKKNFECTKSITSDMVIEKINKIIAGKNGK